MCRDQRAATAIEFAIIAPVMLLLMIASMDLGYHIFMNAVVRGVLNQASRMVATNQLDQDSLAFYINAELAPIRIGDAKVTTITSSYYSFSRVDTAELITSDTEPLGTYNLGDCFEDANSNGRYDFTSGKGGVGGSEDVVRYVVTLDIPRLFPMDSMLGWGSRQTTTIASHLRNEPWGSQYEPATICSS
jgi:Flp pilus assembly protein TadG